METKILLAAVAMSFIAYLIVYIVSGYKGVTKNRLFFNFAGPFPILLVLGIIATNIGSGKDVFHFSDYVLEGIFLCSLVVTTVLVSRNALKNKGWKSLSVFWKKMLTRTFVFLIILSMAAADFYAFLTTNNFITFAIFVCWFIISIIALCIIFKKTSTQL